MKNELCNKIDIFLIQDVEKIEGNNISLKNGKTGYTFQTDDFSITPKHTDSDAGLLYNIEETVVIDKPAEDVCRIFRSKRSVIVRLKSDEHQILIGTKSIPAQIILTNQLNKSQLKINCSCIKSLF